MSSPATTSTLVQHVTVLLAEAVESLTIRPAGTYVDGTFGRGGHSRKILQCLGATGRLIALDRDAGVIAYPRAQPGERVEERGLPAIRVAGQDDGEGGRGGSHASQSGFKDLFPNLNAEKQLFQNFSPWSGHDRDFSSVRRMAAQVPAIFLKRRCSIGI